MSCLPRCRERCCDSPCPPPFVFLGFCSLVRLKAQLLRYASLPEHDVPLCSTVPKVDDAGLLRCTPHLHTCLNHDGPVTKRERANIAAPGYASSTCTNRPSTSPGDTGCFAFGRLRHHSEGSAGECTKQVLKVRYSMSPSQPSPLLFFGVLTWFSTRVPNSGSATHAPAPPVRCCATPSLVSVNAPRPHVLFLRQCDR